MFIFIFIDTVLGDQSLSFSLSAIVYKEKTNFQCFEFFTDIAIFKYWKIVLIAFFTDNNWSLLAHASG